MDVGEIIKDYQVIEHIGRGGMADVWSARDGKLNRMVAIKTIAHGLAAAGDPVGMFEREAQTIANLEHPNILPIYDFGDHHGSLYIVMRYVSGGSLSGWMERGILSLEDALRVMTAIAQALDYAHERGVIHLDLKPQNILLDSNKSPYLADFGLATALDPQGRATNPGSGTLLYMAPEQLTSDSLDKRADIYSFAIMAFHILNGALPYDGVTPMVMKQLQFQQDLPEIPSMPQQVNEALRRSASIDPATRHQTLISLVEELRGALNLTGAATVAPTEFIVGVAPELQEAAAIYQRAKAAWDGGNGRFILGVTDYMVMETAYAADGNDLPLDDLGKQMLLRGALEYGINIDHWWKQLDDVNRRWVCLHAVRSANAPARVRAMRQLELIADDETPRIPRMVAQALQVETDDDVKLAALQLLAARARLRTTTTVQQISEQLTKPITRALTAVARVETREVPPDEWLATTFGPEVDLLIAEMALDPSQPVISEAAARTVASIRSEAAVKYLADQQRIGRKGALRALALVRDQAPNLPDVVSRGGRFYAWAANSLRRMFSHPLTLTWRFIFAVIGAALARGMHLWLNHDLPVTVLQPGRIANSVAFGLVFGVFTGALVLLADEIPSRLRGFWKWPQRAVFAMILGLAAGMLIWAVDAYMYRNVTDIFWDLMAFGGFGLAFGFVFNSLLHLRAWAAVALTAVAIYLPIFASYNNLCTLADWCTESPPFSVGPVAGVGLLIGLFCGVILRLQTGNPRWTMPKLLPARTGWIAATVLGGLWALSVPSVYDLGNTQPPLSWLGVLGFALWGMVPGLIAGYAFNWAGRLGFAAASIGVFATLLAQINPTLQTDGPFPGFDALLYMRYTFDTGLYENNQIFYTVIPFALLIALGGHAQLIGREVREWMNARKARRMEDEAEMMAFLNRPRASLPDTATLIEAVQKAREELIATGKLDAITARPIYEDMTDRIGRGAGAGEGRVLLDAPTGKIEDAIAEEIRRAQESDK
jgi:hypothetical protein